MASDDPLDDRCAKPVRNGEGYCENYPVDGAATCRMHGGTGGAPESNQNAAGNAGGGVPDGNTNAASHGLYAESHAFYQEIATDTERELIDRIYEDYLTRYRERYGDPPCGHDIKLFGIAVNIVKELHAESWTVDKPEEVKTGNALVDRETHYSDQGDKYYRYKVTVVQRAIRSVSNDTRQWLKDLGLLPSADDADATVGITGLGDALKHNSE
jgi:hypothetical protein